MENIFIRAAAFLIGCMGLRGTFAYALKRYSPVPRIVALLTVIPAIGFAVIYMFKLRRTGAETGNERIWWDRLRPVHSLLWLIATVGIVLQASWSWIVLAADTAIGFVGWLLKKSILFI